MTGLTTDDASVYWTSFGTEVSELQDPIPSSCDNGAVLKCAKIGCGGAPTVLAAGGAYGEPVVLGDTLYFVSGADPVIVTCGVDGCAFPQPLTDAGDETGLLMSDGTNLYWISDNNPSWTLWSCTPPSCATPTRLWDVPFSDFVFSAAVDAANVYLGVEYINADNTSGSRVVSCPKSGCAQQPTVLVDVPATWVVLALAVDDTNVYFGGQGGLASCPKAGCTTPSWFVTFPTSAHQEVDFVYSDGAGVFWSESGSAGPMTRSCAVTGCTGAPVVIVPASSLGMDATHVYWMGVQDTHMASTGLTGVTATDVSLNVASK